jgi:hypothetical protein
MLFLALRKKNPVCMFDIIIFGFNIFIVYIHSSRFLLLSGRSIISWNKSFESKFVIELEYVHAPVIHPYPNYKRVAHIENEIRCYRTSSCIKKYTHKFDLIKICQENVSYFKKKYLVNKIFLILRMVFLIEETYFLF